MRGYMSIRTTVLVYKDGKVIKTLVRTIYKHKYTLRTIVRYEKMYRDVELLENWDKGGSSWVLQL